MKKFFSLAVVLALVCMAGTAFAASVESNKMAKATFGDAPAQTFNVKLYNFNSGTNFEAYTGDGADYIDFNIPNNFTYGSSTPVWVEGKTFAKVSSNLAAQTAGTKVYMYTTNSTAGDYKANNSRKDTDNIYKQNGLVRKGNTETNQPGDFAPLKMFNVAISSATANYKTAYPKSVFEQTNLYGNSTRMLLDSGDGNFNALKANEHDTVIGKTGNGGGHWIWCDAGDGHTWASSYTTEDVIIFFAAQFSYVTGGAEYGTTTIKFVTSYDE